jgi:hypothetical protein
MPAFAKDFARSWMSIDSHVGELDKLITGRLTSTLRAHGLSTLADTHCVISAQTPPPNALGERARR